MKPITLICLLCASIAALPCTGLAQQPRTQLSRQREQRIEPRRADATYQLLGFTITTGADDLHDDTIVGAMLTFPDGTTQQCTVHGPAGYGADGETGASANTTWGNGTTHQTPPCRLSKPLSLPELRQTRIEFALVNVGTSLGFDNWEVSRVFVSAYNQGSARGPCVYDVAGDPLARLTGDQPRVTLSDFPNHCR